jgi:hypothetical protein
MMAAQQAPQNTQEPPPENPNATTTN